MRTGTSFRTKIFICMLFAIVVALSVPALYMRLYLDNQLLVGAEQQALREARLTAALLKEHGQGAQLAAFLRTLDTPDMRISLMDSDGRVLSDSSLHGTALPALDNHADRPEVQAAFATGQGVSTRYSNTLQHSTIYAAVRMGNGNIIRIAVPHAAFEARLNAHLNTLGWVGLAAVALALLLAFLLSQWLERSLAHMVRVVEAISLGKYKRRLRKVPGNEFATLADAVNRMAENIDVHINTVADQKGQLLGILETMHDGVLVLDNKGRIRSCNRALVDMFPAALDNVGSAVVEAIPLPALQEAVENLLTSAKAQPLDATPDDTPGEVLNEAQDDMPGEAQNEAQDDTSTANSQSLQLTLPEGRILHVHMARPAGPTPKLGAVAVFHDITTVMRLERIRRDFVTNVSHELRTPLTAIQGYAETLMRLDTLPEDCRRFTEIIHKHGTYLGRMVDELLTLARLENDSETLPLQATNLHDCVQSAVTLCLNAVLDKALHVKVDMPDPLMVHGSHTHLVQVVRNLLENACRYAPPSSAITLRGSTHHKNAQLTVCDAGPGIPPHELGRIFERFYRVDKYRTTHTSGSSTGLGLAICKHIVEKHHGHIWAESPARDAATCVTVLLPLA